MVVYGARTSGLAFGSVGEASADVHRLARVCADEVAGDRFGRGPIDADSSTTRRPLRVDDLLSAC